MHANLQIFPPEDHEDVGKALSLRLGAGEMAAMDAATLGKVDDILVARFDPEADDEPLVVTAWSDLAASIAQEGAEEAAISRLAETGVDRLPTIRRLPFWRQDPTTGVIYRGPRSALRAFTAAKEPLGSSALIS